MKKCTRCKRTKPNAAFTLRRSEDTIRRSRCRICLGKDHQSWRKNNPKKEAASNKRYAQNHPEKIKAKSIRSWRVPRLRKRRQYRHRLWRLRTEYDLTLLGYQTLFDKQKGLCPICNKPLPQGLKAAVDHDKITGKVRGLLHSNCNVALGMLGDESQNAIRAAHYLCVSKTT